jgi:hypothetical protein
VHPGTVASHLGDHLPEESFAELMEIDKELGLPGSPFAPPIYPWYFKNIDQGAATQVRAALDPALEAESGKYLIDSQVHDGDERMAWTWEQANAERLWKLSEGLVGQEFVF